MTRGGDEVAPATCGKYALAETRRNVRREGGGGRQSLVPLDGTVHIEIDLRRSSYIRVWRWTKVLIHGGLFRRSGVNSIQHSDRRRSAVGTEEPIDVTQGWSACWGAADDIG